MPASSVPYEPTMPTTLSPHTAYGPLAVIAAVLDSLNGSGERHHWQQDGISLVLDARSFATWLGDKGRKLLRAAPELGTCCVCSPRDHGRHG